MKFDMLALLKRCILVLSLMLAALLTVVLVGILLYYMGTFNIRMAVAMVANPILRALLIMLALDILLCILYIWRRSIK